MGGRGTFARGNQVDFIYKSVGEIEGVKVLVGINGEHSLPEESHGSWAYIKLKPNGTFHEMRIYDDENYLIKEIAYHPEGNINNGNRTENILHMHEYERDNFRDRPARRLTKDEFQFYNKYLVGLPENVKW